MVLIVEPERQPTLDEMKGFLLRFAEDCGCLVLLLPYLADRAVEAGLTEGVHFKRLGQMPKVTGSIYK